MSGLVSSSDYDVLRILTRQINLYGSSFIFIIGIVSELLTIVIFATLKTFRQTTCSFYLITTSIANIGILIVIFLRIIYDGLNTDLIYTSLVCKCRFFLTQFGGLVSVTSTCLAIIDQYISMTMYKRWSNMMIARRLIAFVSIFWFISSLFNFVYYEYRSNTCIMTDPFFAKYYTYVQSPLGTGFFAIVIMIVFSLLAFMKIRSIASRQLNIVRLSRDRQLTAMTLFHVWFVVVTYIPFFIMFIYNITAVNHESIHTARRRLISTIVIIFFYLGYSVRFFVYRNENGLAFCSFSSSVRSILIVVYPNVFASKWHLSSSRFIYIDGETDSPLSKGIKSESILWK